MSRNGSRLMSTRWLGFSMSSFIRSSRLVPPLMNFAPVLDTAATAACASVARSYVKDLIPDLLRDAADGRDDIGIGGAPTDVAAHPLADLLIGQRDPRRGHVSGGVAGPARLHLGKHADGRTDLAGSAVATLEAVTLDEGALHGVQAIGIAQAFDRHDLVVLMHHGERQTGVDAPAVDQHRAGAALPVITPLLGPAQAQMLAQRVEQRGPWIHLKPSHLIVDAQLDCRQLGHLALAPPRGTRIRITHHSPPSSLGASVTLDMRRHCGARSSSRSRKNRRTARRKAANRAPRVPGAANRSAGRSCAAARQPGKHPANRRRAAKMLSNQPGGGVP